MLRSFDSFRLSFADKVTTGTYNFVSFIVKIILLELASLLSPPTAVETVLCPLKFYFYLEINQFILSDLQTLLKYFNDTAIVAFLKTPFAPFATLFPSTLALYLKDLKLLSLARSALKLVASFLE